MTIILRSFYHLKEHGLGGALLEEVKRHLAAMGIRITVSTIINIRTMHAANSTII